MFVQEVSLRGSILRKLDAFFTCQEVPDSARLLFRSVPDSMFTLFVLMNGEVPGCQSKMVHCQDWVFFFLFFFLCSPEPWGRWDEPNLTSPHMFQMGWFKKPTRRGFQTCLLMEHLLSNEHRAGSGSKSKMISNISPLDLDIFWYVKRHEILPYIFML